MIWCAYIFPYPRHPASCIQLPREFARGALVRVSLDGVDLAIRDGDDAVGHVGDYGVVSDDGRRRAEFLVDA